MLRKYDVSFNVKLDDGNTYKHKKIKIVLKANSAKEALQLAKSALSIEVEPHNKSILQIGYKEEHSNPKYGADWLFGKKMFDKSDLL